MQITSVVQTEINQSINQRNFYSATYKKWTAALDNVNIYMSTYRANDTKNKLKMKKTHISSMKKTSVSIANNLRDQQLLKLSNDEHKASRGLTARAELVVLTPEYTYRTHLNQSTKFL